MRQFIVLFATALVALSVVLGCRGRDIEMPTSDTSYTSATADRADTLAVGTADTAGLDYEYQTEMIRVEMGKFAGRVDLALAGYDSIIVRWPEREDAYMAKASLILNKLSDANPKVARDSAIGILNRCLAANPHHLDSYGVLSALYYANGDSVGSVETLLRGLEHNPSSGDLLECLMSFDHAFVEHKARQRPRPNGLGFDDCFYLTAHGRIEEELGNLEEAVILFKMALVYDFVRKGTLQCLAFCYNKMGEKKWHKTVSPIPLSAAPMLSIRPLFLPTEPCCTCWMITYMLPWAIWTEPLHSMVDKLHILPVVA